MANTHNVLVTLKNKEKVAGPACSEDEAKTDLKEIRSKLGTRDTPDLDWIATTGDSILAAQINKRSSAPRLV